jgi:hypothetical protein
MLVSSVRSHCIGKCFKESPIVQGKKGLTGYSSEVFTRVANALTIIVVKRSEGK